MGSYYSGMMNNEFGYGELRHHGILGQKWGIRRFQNKDGTLTPAGKERYLKASYNGKIGEDEDIYLPKNISLYRVSGENDPSYSDYKYFTFRDNDRDFYRGHFAKEKAEKGETVYEHQYESTSEIKIPSFNKRKQYMLDILNNNDALEEVFGENTLKEYENYYGGREAAFREIRVDLKRYEPDKLARLVATNLGSRPKSLQALKRALIKDGYNALLDDNSTLFAEMPIIIFNPDNVVEQKHSEKLDSKWNMIAADARFRKNMKKSMKFRKNFKTLRTRDDWGKR